MDRPLLDLVLKLLSFNWITLQATGTVVHTAQTNTECVRTRFARMLSSPTRHRGAGARGGTRHNLNVTQHWIPWKITWETVGKGASSEYSSSRSDGYQRAIKRRLFVDYEGRGARGGGDSVYNRPDCPAAKLHAFGNKTQHVHARRKHVPNIQL